MFSSSPPPPHVTLYLKCKQHSATFSTEKVRIDNLPSVRRDSGLRSNERTTGRKNPRANFQVANDESVRAEKKPPINFHLRPKRRHVNVIERWHAEFSDPASGRAVETSAYSMLNGGYVLSGRNNAHASSFCNTNVEMNGVKWLRTNALHMQSLDN